MGASLLAILAGVFDPPADLPNAPLPALGAVMALVAAGLVTANLAAARALRRLDVQAALRER